MWTTCRQQQLRLDNNGPRTRPRMILQFHGRRGRGMIITGSNSGSIGLFVIPTKRQLRRSSIMLVQVAPARVVFTSPREFERVKTSFCHPHTYIDHPSSPYRVSIMSLTYNSFLLHTYYIFYYHY